MRRQRPNGKMKATIFIMTFRLILRHRSRLCASTSELQALLHDQPAFTGWPQKHRKPNALKQPAAEAGALAAAPKKPTDAGRFAEQRQRRQPLALPALPGCPEHAEKNWYAPSRGKIPLRFLNPASAASFTAHIAGEHKDPAQNPGYGIEIGPGTTR